MKRLNIILFVRRLLMFRKPVFKDLTYVDLIIKDRPLLLISWRLGYSITLTIKPLRLTYRNQANAVFVKLPTRLKEVQLIAKNFWRSSKVSIVLKHIKLDDATALKLIQNVEQPDPMTMKTEHITIGHRRTTVRHSSVRVIPFKIHYKKSLQFKAEEFKYS